MTPRKEVILFCEACGASHVAFEGARMWHSQCPARSPRASKPEYKPKARVSV